MPPSSEHQPWAGNKDCCPLGIKCVSADGCVPSADDAFFMCVDARVAEAAVFVTFELIYRVVHQFAVEHVETHQQLKVADVQSCHFAE